MDGARIPHKQPFLGTGGASHLRAPCLLSAAAHVQAATVTSTRCGASSKPSIGSSSDTTGEDFATSDRKTRETLAHPKYATIQAWWHPTKNEGRQPGDFTAGSEQSIWLLCPDCIHGCGRQHEWKAQIHNLTSKGGAIICPACNSRGGSFCFCQSIAGIPRLAAEWHPSNPPAESMPRGSATKKALWLCPEGHEPYMASMAHRAISNSGCPVCAKENRAERGKHPLLSVGRPDLVKEWDYDKNNKTPEKVTLGSRYEAHWKCSRNPEHPGWRSMVSNRVLRGSGCPTCAQDSRNRGKARTFRATPHVDKGKES